MRIVHLYDGHEKVYNGEGSVRDVVWSLASRTADRGHDVTVIERQWRGLPRRSVHEGVEFRRLALRTGADEPWVDVPYEMVSSPVGVVRLLVDRMNFALHALPRLRELEADAIHVHLPFAGNVLAILSPTIRSKMVFTAHLGETEKRVVDPLFSPDSFLAKRAARTVALNPKIREAFETRGVPEEQLVVIPNGVDIERFESVERAEVQRVKKQYGVGSAPVVLFVGTVTPRKGVKELVEAASHVIERHDDVSFLIVGDTELDPNYVEEVETTITSTDTEDSVILTGFVSEAELLACYELADLFVLPSFEEGSSIAVTEAMAAGLPIVGSRIDGIRQQVERGKHGLLVDPGDTTRLAEAISRLVANGETRRDMAAAIEARAENLSWEQITGRMLEVYSGVAG